jgi:hypothetical protein
MNRDQLDEWDAMNDGPYRINQDESGCIAELGRSCSSSAPIKSSLNELERRIPQNIA